MASEQFGYRIDKVRLRFTRWGGLQTAMCTKSMANDNCYDNDKSYNDDNDKGCDEDRDEYGTDNGYQYVFNLRND